MPYSYNPHRHVKIWLSQDQDCFLNLENQMRLAAMRATNPDDEIYFVYDSSLLSLHALDDLNHFCRKHNIISKEVYQDIFSACSTQEERDLIAIYQEEIRHLHNGGNLAVGSDILRWLEPVYKLGTYSDFDLKIDTRHLGKTVEVEKSLLLNIGSSETKFIKRLESVALNNDIVAVVNLEDALPLIQNIQKAIILACRKPNIFSNNTAGPFLNCQRKLRANFEAIIGENYDLLLLLSPLLAARDRNLNTLSKLNTNRSPLEMRSEIMRFTNNNLAFCIYNASPNVKHYADLVRQQTKINFWTWLLLSKKQYHDINALLALDDEQLITTLRETTREILLKETVICTTGPFCVASTLFPTMVYETAQEFDREVTPYALAHYSLDKAFISKNSIPLHAQNIQSFLEAKVGEKNDLSWLEIGREATRVREEKIQGAAKTLTSFYHKKKAEKQVTLPSDFANLKKKIEAHIIKINQDLTGAFGFYRNTQRRAKLAALEGILSHFAGSVFNVDAYKKELATYQSTDIFASFGKSKTKELIDELTLFSRQAKAFSVTQASGTVTLYQDCAKKGA